MGGFKQIFSLLEDVHGAVSSEAILRKWFFARCLREGKTLSQFANRLLELLTTLQWTEEAVATLFTNTELVV